MTDPTGIIALDPGVTIGFARLQLSGRMMWGGEIRTHDPGWDHALETMIGDMMKRGDHHLVCEEGPRFGRHHSGTLGMLEGLIEHLSTKHGVSLHWVTPGRWKNTPAATLTADDRDRVRSKHGRDAIGMGRYWLYHNAKQHYMSDKGGRYNGY